MPSGESQAVWNPCVMAAHRGHPALPGPAEVAQARNNDRLGSVGGLHARVIHARVGISCALHPGNTPSAGACHVGIGCRTATETHRPCALGSTRASATTSLGSWSTAVAAMCCNGRPLSRPSQLSECRPAAPGVGGCALKASFAVTVRPLWSREHVRAGSGRWLRGHGRV